MFIRFPWIRSRKFVKKVKKMSSNAQPANEANVQNDRNRKVGEVVNFPSAPAVEITDYKIHPLTKAAHDLYYASINVYTDAGGREHKECRRHYLTWPDVKSLAQALGRQITVEEVHLLVGLDGETVPCSVTGRFFQPVWWTIITPGLIRYVALRKVLDEDILSDAPLVGMYFPHPKPDTIEHFVVSGVPFYWDKNRNCIPAFWSPLRDVYKLNSFQWGTSRRRSDEVLIERKARQEEQEVRKAGLARMADVFKTSKSDRRDRRPDFKPKR